MKSCIRIMGALALATALVGCSTSRSTTTARTAIEMALVSQSAENTLEQFESEAVNGKKFVMDDSQFEATDKAFALSGLRLQLLKMGGKETAADEAEVIVRPRVAIAAIDDFSFLLGIPSIPIPVPMSGTTNTPELYLLKRDKHLGRNRMGVYALNASDKSLAEDFGIKASQVYYSRWSILGFINWRKTDLEEPYRTVAGK